jgi:predicted DNA-binding transcriptional regulator YafY
MPGPTVAQVAAPRTAPDNKVARMLRLEKLLGQNSIGIELKHIAAALSVDSRTAKRYLAEWEALGRPLSRSQSGSGRTLRYSLPQEEGVAPALIKALQRGRDELRKGGNLKHARVLDQAIAHFESQSEVENIDLETIYHIDHGPLSDADPDRALLDRLERAITQRRTLRIDYANPDGRHTTFIFQPYRICLRIGVLYLAGRQGGDMGPVRLLRLVRIRRCLSLGESFTPPAFDPASLYKFCFGQWSRQENQKAEDVTLWIRAPWLKGHLETARFDPPARISQQEGRVLFKIKVVLHPDFINWVMSLMPDAVPIEPGPLRDEVARRLEESREALKPEGNRAAIGQ